MYSASINHCCAHAHEVERGRLSVELFLSDIVAVLAASAGDADHEP